VNGAHRALTGLAIAMVAAASGPLHAGDVAERAIIGFSPEARTFAFEEFGVEDGSGFPYATVFLIDTESDRWLSGTPVHVVLEDGKADVGDARSRARALAAAPMRDAGVVEGDFVVLASQPLGEYPADPRTLSFGVPGFDPLGAPVARYRLELAGTDVPLDAACAPDAGGEGAGYALTLRDLATDQAVLLHRDARVPRSRGCPIDYGISDAVVAAAGDASVLAVLVSVFRQGFEGPDRRFLAVTGHLPR
jgi:predicted secreted protein